MSKAKKKVILLTAGGTGGHFFPAVALAEELNLHKDVETHISTDNRCKKYLTNDIKVEFHIVDLYINFQRKFAGVRNSFSIMTSLIKALILLLRLKPKLIVGFGGYPTFPIMFIGKLLAIPSVIYEQNCFLGRTNKVFAKKSRLIALAYENTHNLPKKYLVKSLVVGDLIRNNIKDISEKEFSNHRKIPAETEFTKKSNSGLFNLLVIGGSQGAKIFSTLVPETIKILLEKYPDTNINITQQVREEDQEDVRKIYDDLKINYLISDFFYDIQTHYKKCNLIIARAGASTIAELSHLGLPAILVPFPSAADDHQYYNAKSLEDNNASWCYRQDEVTAEILADKLHSLIINPDLIKQASLNILKRKKDGTKHLADTVLKII